MRCSSVFLNGVSSVLGDRIEHPPGGPGGLSRRDLRALDIESVRVSNNSGPQLAIEAGKRTLSLSGKSPSSVGGLLHANTYYQGHDMWSPASFVQDGLRINGGITAEVRQVSAGALVALDVACRYVQCEPSRTILITTGDTFRDGFARWTSDPGTAYGDAGTAALVASSGLLQLLSISVFGDPSLEAMHRDQVHHGRTNSPRMVDLGDRQRRFIASHRREAIGARLRAGLASAHRDALTDAGLDTSDISWFVLPNFGARRMRSTFFGPLDIPPSKSLWRWGRTVGHLGAGDQLAGLAHLVDCGRLSEGDYIELIAVGAGFTWASVVIQFLPESSNAI